MQKKNNEWSAFLLVRDSKVGSKQVRTVLPCHLFNTMADVTSISDSENLDKTKEAKAQAESVKDDAESEAEDGASEFEIEEVLDAKRGYFPEVCTANWHQKSC